MDISDHDELKYLILNTHQPLIFKQLLNWEILKWDLKDWETKLEDEILEFRLGKFSYTTDPQWERQTDVINSTFKYFLQFTASDESKWLYFDYKYLDKWFTSIKEFQNIEPFAALGFPNIKVADCTMWMGTKGAHTPCHVDTYGFNLILQVYGRKLWIVVPPEENLLPSRIPYEESSIYSKLNFFSPNVADFRGVHNCRKVILNPGEVLCLPYKWWHYVENLETAISINVWIPLPQDDEERLKESVVQLFVKQMVNVSSKAEADVILNPNMQEDILNSDTRNIIELINKLKNICKDKVTQKKIKKDETESTEAQNHKMDVPEILKKYSNVAENIPKMTQEEFKIFLEEQRGRFNNTPTDECQLPQNEKSDESDFFKLLDSITDNDVVSLISEKLLRNTC